MGDKSHTSADLPLESVPFTYTREVRRGPVRGCWLRFITYVPGFDANTVHYMCIEYIVLLDCMCL
jgi:hypothetical protein